MRKKHIDPHYTISNSESLSKESIETGLTSLLKGDSDVKLTGVAAESAIILGGGPTPLALKAEAGYSRGSGGGESRGGGGWESALGVRVLFRSDGEV